jgi:hypothetical protein
MGDVVIRKDRCVITIYDINSFTGSYRIAYDLWKLMFSAPWQNEETIALFRGELPKMVAEAVTCIKPREAELGVAEDALARAAAEYTATNVERWSKEVTRLRRVAKKAVGSAKLPAEAQLSNALANRDALKLAKAKAREAKVRLKAANIRYERLVKLQTKFNQMAEKAKV